MVSLQGSGRPGVAAPVSASTKSYWPTRKWWAATVIALGAIATLWVTKGELDKDVMLAAIGVIVQAITTYLVPNQDSPGGVPARST
jgi:hypothetical protein